MNILKITILAWGLILASSAGAASKATESSETNAQTRDAASGLPTGKRQHKPVNREVVSPRDAASGLPTGKRQHKPFSSTNVDNDCDGKTSSVCKKKFKKSKMTKKGYDYYSSSSSMKSKKAKQNGEDLILRKKPGRAADGDDKGKKKKPLKHEK